MEKCLTLFAVLGVVWAAFSVPLTVGIAVALPSPLEGFEAASRAGGGCGGRAAQSGFGPAHVQRWDLSTVKSLARAGAKNSSIKSGAYPGLIQDLSAMWGLDQAVPPEGRCAMAVTTGLTVQ